MNNFAKDVNNLVREIGKRLNDFANPDEMQNLLIEFIDRNCEHLNGEENE